MKTRFIDFIQSNHLVEPNDNIIVALSGGSDSVSLLHLFKECKNELGINSLYAAHINHGIRGENARNDMLFCRKLCDQWDIPIIIDVVDVPNEAANSGESIEQAARRIRYKSLNKHAHNLSAKVATAHTLSDNTETVLFNLVRGTGIQGVSGIPIVNDCIIRPLLFTTKDEIEEYCESNHIQYVFDESNDDINYSRNRIRKNIIPELKKLNSNLDYSIGKFTNIVQNEVNFLDDESEKIIQESYISEYVFNKKIIAKYPKVLRMNAYRSMVFSSIDVEYKHYLAIDDLVFHEGALCLPGDVIVQSDKEKINFNLENITIDSYDYNINGKDCIIICGEKYQMKVFDRKEFDKIKNVNNLFYNYCFAYDKIIGDLHVRQRCNGDSYQPVNRCNKSLKKLFNEAKMPFEKRLKTPVICDDEGIVMAYGFGCDERVRITEETKNVFVFIHESLL